LRRVPTPTTQPPCATKSNLKAKGKAKKIKAKRSAAKGPVAVYDSVVGRGHEWEWDWAGSGDEAVNDVGGGLEKLFGTNESRAATLAQIMGVQAATAMAATAHLRKV
jgi:hypothetical protein